MPQVRTTLIDADALAALAGDPSLRIVDCRFQLTDPGAGRAAWLAGHLPGAVHADLETDLSGPVTPRSGRHPLPDPEALAATLGQLGISNSHQVVVYDDAGGVWAARLWWLLRWLGHGPVAVLDGGLAAWRAGGRELEAGEVRYPVARFVPGQALTREVTTADVLEGRVGRLLDARAPERYRGESEPLDPVAGHVPGAINHPCTENLDAAGRFLPAARVKEQLLESLAGANPEAVAAMCGSGVTACHLLLAMEHAGLRGAGLYAGSWSEWIRDPRRPVAGAGRSGRAQQPGG